MNGAYKSPHWVEISFMLHSFDKVRPRGGAWSSSARTSDPSGAGMPKWPAYDAGARGVMEFNLKPRVVNDPLSGARQILATIPPAVLWRM